MRALDRREFLLASLAAAALPRVPSLATPKFGYAAITWGGNDRAAIDDISAVGYRGIQLRASAVQTWAGRPQELADLLHARQLTFVALSSGVLQSDPATRDENMAMHMRHAEFARAAGCAYLQVVDQRPRDREITAADYRDMGRRLTELGQRTADLGVALGYHNHMGNLGQAPEEVERVLSAADTRFVKLELDIAHWQAAGGDPVAAVREYRDQLLFLHLKDLQRPAPGRPAGSYRFVELGAGEVNVAGVLDALIAIGFDGWSIVELDAVTDTARSAKDSAVISKEFLRSRGLPL
jgi:inosose dehydratase